MGELTASKPRKEFDDASIEFQSDDAKEAWNNMSGSDIHSLITNLGRRSHNDITEIVANNCMLYFPHNRFEEPAWLNKENLNYRVRHMGIERMQGHTPRTLVNYSLFRGIQDWLFDIIYDMATLDTQVSTYEIVDPETQRPRQVRALDGYQGRATNVQRMAVRIARLILGREVELGSGNRMYRKISFNARDIEGVESVFQLSSGEISLFCIFLSILRDFDLAQQDLRSLRHVRGIVVVDEVDLHLHANHQYNILPALIGLFPQVQFVVTTHSPLFVMGMDELLGSDGFALVRLPDGSLIDTEEFGEFRDAYQAFSGSGRFLEDLREAVTQSYRPVVYVEGDTDVMYVRRAAAVLGMANVLDGVELRSGGGSRLNVMWRAIVNVPDELLPTIVNVPDELLPNRIMVLHDCDFEGPDRDVGARMRRVIPRQVQHPIQVGIENLFNRGTLERARREKTAFLDVVGAHVRVERGVKICVRETWTVNADEKMNLCRWLCTNGDADDFSVFQSAFEIIKQLVQVEVNE